MMQFIPPQPPDLLAVESRDLKLVINEIQECVGAPKALVVSSVLAALSTAVQGVVDVLKPNGQKTPASMMYCTVADSGERKSTAEDICFGPIKEFEREAKIVYLQQEKVWRADHEIWEIKKNAQRKEMIDLKKNGLDWDEAEELLRQLIVSEPVKPILPKVVYVDATTEAFFRGMSENWSSAALVSSEGAGLLNGKIFGDLSKLNAIWSGEEIVVDRIRGGYTLQGRLTAAIQVQSTPFLEFLKKRGKEVRDSGLLARFLVCFPSSTQGTRFSGTTKPLAEGYVKYKQRLNKLMSESAKVQDAKSERQLIGFTTEAQAMWWQAFDSVESCIKPGYYFEGFGDLASKAMDQVSRLAVIMHCFNGGGGDVPLSILKDAMSIGEWYSSEFIRLFKTPPREHQDALELESWFKDFRNTNQRFLRKNFIRQCGPNSVRNRNHLDHALYLLSTWGCIRVVQSLGFQIVDLFPAQWHDQAHLDSVVRDFKSRQG